MFELKYLKNQKLFYNNFGTFILLHTEEKNTPTSL